MHQKILLFTETDNETSHVIRLQKLVCLDFEGGFMLHNEGTLKGLFHHLAVSGDICSLLKL